MKRTILPALWIISLAGGFFAQVPSNHLHVGLRLVHVTVTVTTGDGQPVTDLTHLDFRVSEDNKPQRIVFFDRMHLTTTPLRAGILIESGKAKGQKLSETEALAEFLRSALVHRGRDQAFLMAPQLVQDYTSDLNQLTVSNSQMSGPSKLYDSVFFACKEKLLFFPSPEPYLRRILIIMSDGEDAHSAHTAADTIKMAQRADVAAYALIARRSRFRRQGESFLLRLAEETGGRAFFVPNPGEASTSFHQISNDLNNQYGIEYVSTNGACDGTYRTIVIETNRKGLHVLAKPGYFADGAEQSSAVQAAPYTSAWNESVIK